MTDQPLTFDAGHTAAAEAADAMDAELPVAGVTDPAEATETALVITETGDLAERYPAAERAEGPLNLLNPTKREVEWIAQAFIASGYIKDARDFGKAVTKIIAGLEIGVAPFQAMRGLHIIDGKPEMSAGLVGALVKRSGKYDYLPKTWTDTECVLEWYQDREPVGESSFSKADAERANLWRKNVWRTYPKAMLFARALTQGARAYCPDVFGGAIYAEGELDA